MLIEVTPEATVVVVPVALYVNVVVPDAPLESVAVMTYVPVVHAEFPPAFVEYENVPPVPTATFAASRTCEDPCRLTWMFTLSGRLGVGVIVPEMV